MKFELTQERISLIDAMLGQGANLAEIARSLGVGQSTLRWKLGRAGFQVVQRGHLQPIHAAPIAAAEAAATAER